MTPDWSTSPPDLSTWLFAKEAWSTGTWHGSAKGIVLSVLLIAFWVRTARPGYTEIDRALQADSNLKRWAMLPFACLAGLVVTLFALVVWRDELIGIGYVTAGTYAIPVGLLATPLLIAALAMRIAPYGRKTIKSADEAGRKRQSGAWAAGLTGATLFVLAWLAKQGIDAMARTGVMPSSEALHAMAEGNRHAVVAAAVGTLIGLWYSSETPIRA